MRGKQTDPVTMPGEASCLKNHNDYPKTSFKTHTQQQKIQMNIYDHENNCFFPTHLLCSSGLGIKVNYCCCCFFFFIGSKIPLSFCLIQIYNLKPRLILTNISQKGNESTLKCFKSKCIPGSPVCNHLGSLHRILWGIDTKSGTSNWACIVSLCSLQWQKVIQVV